MKKSKILTGAQIVIEILLEQRVDRVFGYPGGQVLDIYDALASKRGKITHVLTAHEQGAAHAADGYARASGKVGVVIATSGPGASNLVTGIATAYLDSVPMVAITGNVPTDQIGTDSFQELDIADISMPITKHNYIVKNVEELAPTLREAFAIARSGRKGPVLVDIPKDIQKAKCRFCYEDDTFIESYDDHIPDRKSAAVNRHLKAQLDEAAKLINASQRPFIYCGGGVISSGAESLIEKLANIVKAPVGCSLMGLAAVDGGYPGKLGLTGIHGLESANLAMKRADLIIAAGTRFNDRSAIGPDTAILQIDIDPAEINKNLKDTAYIVGDIKDILQKIIPEINPKSGEIWATAPDAVRASDPRIFSPFDVIDTVAEYTNGMTVVTDVGQHQMWVAQRYPLSKCRFITSGGLGTMGFGMGAAIGASMAEDCAPVLLFTGDGSFGMNLGELATAVSYNIPLLIIVMNNRSLGMVKQWQKRIFGRISQSELHRKTDFVKVAEAFGARGAAADSIESLNSALRQVFSQRMTAPFLINCMIDQDAEAEIFSEPTIQICEKTHKKVKNK